MAEQLASVLARPSTICLVAPALPPKLDGIGDYTSCLVRELSRLSTRVVVLTNSRANPDPIPGVVIRGIFDPESPKSDWNLVNAIKAECPNWIIVQYNPFGYGRRGLNLQLYKVLRHLKKSAGNSRLAIMFHETYTPFVNLRLAIMAIWQRWQFKRIGASADVMFYSIEPWAEKHRSWFPGKPIHHLPVGSNIPRIEISKSQARLRLGIKGDDLVLGVFGSAHISRLFGMVRDAAVSLRKAGRKVLVLYIGPDGGQIHSLLGDIPSITDGPFPADEVSRRLSAVDIFLATYVDGVSTRRGAMMAALQHGLPVVGTIGINTDPELAAVDGKAMQLVLAGDSDAYSAAVLALANDPALQAELATGALDLFNRRYSWPAIAANMMNVLAAVSSPVTPVNPVGLSVAHLTV